MIALIKKIIKRQKLLRKYKKGKNELSDLTFLLSNFDWSYDDKHFFIHHYNCENRCYNRIKKL